MNPLTIVSIHRNLRAIRTRTRHCEGIVGSYVVIRDGDKEMAIDAEAFFAIAERLQTQDFSANDVRYGEWDF